MKKLFLCFTAVLLLTAFKLNAGVLTDLEVQFSFIEGGVEGNHAYICPCEAAQIVNRSHYVQSGNPVSGLQGTYRAYRLSPYINLGTISATTWTYGATWNLGICDPFFISNHNFYIEYVPTGSESIYGGTPSSLFYMNYVTMYPNPTVSAGPDVSICPGQSTTLNATGAVTYNWAPATGLSSTTVANPVASPTVTTNYTVTGTNGNGCQRSDIVTVTVHTAPGITFVPNGQTICKGDPVTISTSVSGGGTLSYSWSILNTISPNTFAGLTGTGPSITLNYSAYSPYVKTSPYGFQYIAVRVVVNNGNCTSEAICLIIFNQPITYSYTSQVDLCYNGTNPPPPAYFSVNAPNAWGFTWQYSSNGGATWNNCAGPTFTGLGTATLCIPNPSSLMNNWRIRCILEGNYCPDITTNSALLRVLACARTDGSTIEMPFLPVAAAGETWTTRLPADAGEVLFVMLQQGDENGENWQTIAHALPADDGSVTASAGEEVFAAGHGPMQWVIVKSDGNVIILDAHSRQDVLPGQVPLNVFPNPADDELNISGISGESQVMVLAIDGRVISVTPFVSETVKLNTGGLAPGMYLLRVSDANGVRTKQFIRR